MNQATRSFLVPAAIAAVAIAVLLNLGSNSSSGSSPKASDVAAPQPAFGGEQEGIVEHQPPNHLRTGISADLSLSPVTVSGTAVLEDLRGGVHPISKGTITFSLSHDGIATGEATATVISNVWTLSGIATGSRVQCNSAALGSSKMTYLAEPVDSSVRGIEDWAGQALRFTAERGALIRVFDAATMVDLKEFTIVPIFVTEERFRVTSCVPPQLFANGPLREILRSPAYRPKRNGVITAWVGADGYKWERIAYDAYSELVEIGLARGGGIDITILGADRLTPYTALFAFRTFPDEGSEGVWPQPLAVQTIDMRSQIALDGLPEGEVVICVGRNKYSSQLGPWWSMSRVEVTNDERAQLTIDLSPGVTSAYTASLFVRLNRDAAMEAAQGRAQLYLENPNTHRSGLSLTEPMYASLAVGEDGFARANGLIPGRCVLTLVPFGYSVEVLLEPGVLTTVEMDAAVKKAEMTLEFLDPYGNALSGLEVRVRHGDSGLGVSWITIGKTGQTGRVTTRKPHGEWSIVASGHRFLNEVYRVDHALGEGVHTIEIQEIPIPISLVIKFKKGPDFTKLPLEYLMSVRVRSLGGVGKVLKMQGLGRQLGYLGVFASHGIAVDLSAEGEYEVVLPKFPGMDDVLPKQVTVVAGQENVLDIDI